MTSPKSILCLLLLVGLVAAFDVSDYLYPGEENLSITYINFTLNGDDYSIVELAGEQTFLLKEGEAVTEQSEIDSVIYSYYLEMHYPSEEEITDLRELLESYNESRNDGQKFVGKEEYACRSVLFIDGRVKAGPDPIYCRTEADEELCNYSAMLMYQYLSSLTTPPVASWEHLVDPIKDFGFSSHGIDVIIDTAAGKLDDAEEDRGKMYDALEYIDDSISDLESYQSKIETSQFGWTEKKTCDSDHWCLCPDMDLNDSALDDMEDSSQELMGKMGPFKNYKGVADEVYSETSTRMERVHTEKLAADYTAAFSSLNSTGEQIISLADEAATHLSNATLSSKLFSLKSLHQTIPEDIEDRNFATMEDDIAEYEALLEEVNESASLLMGQYNDTREAKNFANSLIFVLESKDLDPVSMKSLDLLKNKSADLDAEFRDGLTMGQFATLEANYTDLADEAQQLLKAESDMPASQVLLLFRGYARKVNTGIAHVAETSSAIEPREIPEESFTLGLFSALVFLSLASIVALVFLYVMSTMKFVIPKSGYIVAAAFACLLLVLLGFSIFMYLFLGKTSIDATLPEFLADFEAKESTSMLVDLRNTSYADSMAMGSCADSLADSFEARNKSWTMYTVTSTTCTQKDSEGYSTPLSIDACMDKAQNETSLFVLEYSASNEPPKFSVIYKNKAEIRANLDYYESCPLVALFS